MIKKETRRSLLFFHNTSLVVRCHQQEGLHLEAVVEWPQPFGVIMLGNIDDLLRRSDYID
jgi:hypothetical protein